MLKDLKILNGFLELEYNEYTYEYTAVVESDVTNLDISYVLSEGTYINIRNNNLVSDENIVYIDVYNEEKTITYTIFVYREKTEEVSGIDNFVASLQVSDVKEVSLYEMQILCCGVFLIILIVFSVIFRRKKLK